MFRRRRDNVSSPRPPVSSAWWDAPRDDAADRAAALGQPPPLPSHDPFGAWPAFPPPGEESTDAVLGQSPPAPPGGWSVPGMPAGGPPPRPMPGGSSVPSVPPPPPPAPPPFGAYPPAAPPIEEAAPPVIGGDAPEWLPLLTHEHQRFQIELEEFALAHEQPPAPEAAEELTESAFPRSRGPATAAVPHGMLPWTPPEAPRRGRAARLRGARAHRPAEQSEPTQRPDGLALDAPAPPADAYPVSGHEAQPERPAAEQGLPGRNTGLPDPADEVNPMEAAALAGAFAADYLSWDESSPQRRGQVLLQYLPSDVRGSAAQASLLGWSGKGRQRSEFALPGAVHPDGDGRVVVDVRVRVTPYRAVGLAAEPAYEAAEEMEVAGVPSSAPAPTARGWKSLDSYWVRLAVPVARDHGRLVVDTWDESLSDPDPAPRDPDPAAERPAVPKPSDLAAAKASTHNTNNTRSREARPSRASRATGRSHAAASSCATPPSTRPEPGGAP
jgi:hypothetical protein